MADKIISVVKGEVKTKDDKSWVELTDGEGKVSRIFASTQGNDGVWVHLDKEIDMLKAQIEDGSIVGKAFSLTKEKKGQYWNVIGIKSVESQFVKQAQKEVTDKTIDERQRSMALSYSKDLVVAGRIHFDQMLSCAETFYLFIMGTTEALTPLKPIAQAELATKVSQPVLKPSPEAPKSKPSPVEPSVDSKVSTASQVKGTETPPSHILRQENIKAMFVQLGWLSEGAKVQTVKVGDYLVKHFQKRSLKDLSTEQLTELESLLQKEIEMVGG